jgi:hypothetical protein
MAEITGAGPALNIFILFIITSPVIIIQQF